MCSIRRNNQKMILETYKIRGLIKEKNNIINDFKLMNNIIFSDNIWDFSYLNKLNRESSNYKFNFSNISEEYLNYIKVIVLEEIIYSQKKIQTINKTFDILRTISNEFNTLGVISPILVNDTFIKDYINNKEKVNGYGYLSRVIPVLKQLLLLIYNLEEKCNDDIIRYLDYKYKYYNSLKHKKSSNEYIPDDFLNNLVSCAVKDGSNNKFKETYRIFSNLLIIVAETGMRIEELILLETNKLNTIKVGDKDVYYLNFISTKSASNDNGYKDTYCYLTDLAADAYKRAERIVNQLIDNMSLKVKFNLYRDIIKNEMKDIDWDKLEINNFEEVLSGEQLESLNNLARRYIFISDHTCKKISHTSSLRDYMYRFVIRNNEILSESAKKNPEDISYLSVKSNSIFEKFYGRGEDIEISFEDIKDIKYPYVNFHRFRVTVCTKLYQKGIPLDFIRSHLNHLYDDMTCYYIKNEKIKNELEENIELLKDIVDENGYINKSLDDNDIDVMNIENKIKKINSFLKKNKLNIKSDLKKILVILNKTQTTIVENEFGVCVKSLISGICKKRKYFNSDRDNYYIGLELETFKYIDLNYERFKQKKEIIEHNKKLVKDDEELRFEFDREVKSLKYFINKTLVKELDLLENEINLNGMSNVIKSNENLEFIITNIAIIKGEINAWI